MPKQKKDQVKAPKVRYWNRPQQQFTTAQFKKYTMNIDNEDYPNPEDVEDPGSRGWDPMAPQNQIDEWFDPVREHFPFTETNGKVVPRDKFVENVQKMGIRFVKDHPDLFPDAPPAPPTPAAATPTVAEDITPVAAAGSTSAGPTLDEVVEDESEGEIMIPYLQACFHTPSQGTAPPEEKLYLILVLPSGWDPRENGNSHDWYKLSSCGKYFDLKLSLQGVFGRGIRRLFKHNDLFRSIYRSDHPAVVAYDSVITDLELNDGGTVMTRVKLLAPCARITPIGSSGFMGAVPKVSAV